MIKSPINTIRARQIVQKARQDLLKERIRIIHNKLNNYKEKHEELQSCIFAKVSQTSQEDIVHHTNQVRESTHKKVKQRHLQKFEKLAQRSKQQDLDLSGTQLKKWVHNLSQYQLTDSQTQVLARGLNFAVTPTSIPVEDYVVATEQATWSIPQSQRDELRAEISGILKNAKVPKSNLCAEEKNALQTLRQEKSIKILAADKGRATVVMDTSNYEDKMKAMLADRDTYTKLKSDPTKKFKQELIKMLNKLEKEKKITKQQYWYLYPTLEKVPRMYGSPKIHKPDTPLRPIVDYTQTIAYKVSRDLADILQPLVGKSEHHVENSKSLVEEVKSLHINEDEMFVSYDVVSLFTKTPIEGALITIEKRLKEDQNLKKRTFLHPVDIIELLKFVLETTYFRFGGEFYQQKFGVAMGSPVSPIVVNLYMEALEKNIIQTSPDSCKPRWWRRYVDDVVTIVKRGKAEQLQNHMNQVDTTNSIKFTREEEAEDGSIAFLDTRLIRREDGSVKTVVYRKTTHTDQYLNYRSHHPLHQKRGVVKTLMNRCQVISSEEADKEKETLHLKNALKRCGYPAWMLKEDVAPKGKDKPREKRTDQGKFIGQVVVPYVQGTTEKIIRVLKKHKVSTAVRPYNTLRQFLVHPKDKTSKEDNGELVYQIPCKMCEKVYIGETGRQLKTRLEEHRKEVNAVTKNTYTRSTRKQSEGTVHKSAITDHATTENHIIDWEGTKIIDREGNKRKRHVKEAIWIRRTRGAINRDAGSYELSHLYDTVIKQHQRVQHSH